MSYENSQFIPMLIAIRDGRFLAANHYEYHFNTQEELDEAITNLLDMNYIKHKFSPTYATAKGQKKMSWETKEYVITPDGMNYLSQNS